MTSLYSGHIHALLFGLNEDLAGELTPSLAGLCSDIQSVDGSRGHDNLFVGGPTSRIIFCGPSASLVTKLRAANPLAAIVVVSRHPEVSDWLDSIEAGATDYCAAPFEPSQIQWIVETSMRSTRTSAAA